MKKLIVLLLILTGCSFNEQSNYRELTDVEMCFLNSDRDEAVKLLTVKNNIVYYNHSMNHGYDSDFNQSRDFKVFNLKLNSFLAFYNEKLDCSEYKYYIINHRLKTLEIQNKRYLERLIELEKKKNK